MNLSQIRMARLATNALFFTNGLSFASWASRIPDIKENLHLSDAALGTVLFSAPIGSLSALPLAGFLIHKFSSRKIALVSTLFYLIAMPFLGLATTAWQLALALFMFGFGGDLLNISMNVQAVGIENALSRSIMSSFHAVFSIGFMLGAAVGGVMASAGVLPSNHLAGTGFFTCAIGLITFRFLLKQDGKQDQNQPLFALPDQSLLLLSLICFCAMLCEGAVADWSVLYYKQVLANTKGFVTAGFTVFSVAMVVGRLFGDYIVANLGLRKTLFLHCVILTVGMLMALVWPMPLLVVFGFGFAGLGLSIIVPLIYSEAGHSATMSAGVALAAITTVGMAGFLFGPVLIGYLSEYTSLRTALGLLVVLGLVGARLSLKVGRNDN